MRTTPRSRIYCFILPFLILLTASGCTKDGPDNRRSKTYTYTFNTGQSGAGTAYTGQHPKTMVATVKLEEQVNTTTRITVSLTNTITGRQYPVNVYDAREPSGTDPLPFTPQPNTTIFSGNLAGNGATVTASNISTATFEALTETYEGYFVVHDINNMSQTDVRTFLIYTPFGGL